MLPRMSGLLVLVAALSAGSAGLLCRAQKPQTGQSLRYHFGDDPDGKLGWANPVFDDSAWPIAENGRWPVPPFYSNGFVWLRIRVPVRSDVSGPLDVRIKKDFFSRGLGVAFANEVYVGGVVVGAEGSAPPHVHLYSSEPSAVYQLQSDAITPGKAAIVAVRIWCPPYLRVSGFSGSMRIEVDEGRNLQLAQRADHSADLYANGLDLALDIGIGLLGLAMFAASRWTADRNLLVFSWVMIPQAILLLIWNPTLPGLERLPSQVGLDVFLTSLTLFMVALVELNWTVHHLRAPVLKRLTQAVAVLFTFSILVAGVATTPVPIASWFMRLTLPADIIFESALVAVNVVAILKRSSNPLLALALLGNPLIELLNDAGLVPYGVRLGAFYEHTIALADFVIDIAIFILLSRGAWKAWRARDELRVELEAAREVQEQLVAPATDVPGFQIESVYAPAKRVGGDFFRVLSGEDGSVLVVVGDVSGKGLKAAMTVSAIMGALRGNPSRRPTDVLAHLNRVLCGQVSGFVTCCVAHIASDGPMTIANAGNPAPYCNGGELPVEAGLPLGLIADIDYPETRFLIAPGDRLMFVSDGVVEATNLRGELYGFERTQAISTESAQKVAQAAQAFGQEDDITVLSVVRSSGQNLVIG